jgi:hypothetical protein
MSETIPRVTTARPRARPARQGRRPAWRSPAGWLIGFFALLALALRVYLVVRPGVLAVTQYDDGPYFGSAVRLVHGVLPYRDYAFVQPPGITVLLAPAAAATYAVGTAWGLVAARFLTALAGAAAVVLAGRLVLHRGAGAVLVTCGIVAVYPPGAQAAHTVLLEPWLVLFCLAGAVAVFDGDQLAGPRRLAFGGAAFGFAAAVKIWALAPVAVILLLCLPRRRRTAAFTLGVAAGFLVPVLPFLIAAPQRFYNSVVTAQVARIGTPVPVWHRLQDLLGIVVQPDPPHRSVLVAAIAVLVFAAGTQLAVSAVARELPAALDWFATASAVLIAAMFLWPRYFAAHYAAFFGPFLALALALALARLGSALHGWLGSSRAVAALGWCAAGAAAAGLVAVGVFAVAPLHSSAAPRTLPAAAARVIPPGACVLTDQASYLLLANRFVSAVPGCPQMVDSLGTDLALSGGRRPATGAARSPAVGAAWRAAFQRAGYVLLSAKNAIRVPWSPGLTAYFHRHFGLVLRRQEFAIYIRRGSTSG